MSDDKELWYLGVIRRHRRAVYIAWTRADRQSGYISVITLGSGLV